MNLTFNASCWREPDFFHFCIIHMPALTSPLLLYIVPMCGPDRLRKVWNLEEKLASSGFWIADLKVKVGKCESESVKAPAS